MSRPLKLSDLNPVFREALATFEAMRRFGFTPDQIYMSVGQRSLFCTVKSSIASESFSIRMGPMPLSKEEFQAEWEKVCELWKNGTEKEHLRIWDHSVARTQTAQLLVLLKAKGIRVPIMQKGKN
jgi:hypothetical protein